MKPILSVAFATWAALFLVPLAGTAQDQSTSSATDQEILQAVERYRAALTKKDTATLEQIWADDYTFVNGAGDVMSKKQRLENIKSGATSLDSITQREVKVRSHQDTGVVTSAVTIQGQYSGKKSGGDYRSMMVWVKMGADWRLIANQLTAINKK